MPHLQVWETTQYVAIGTGPERFVWAYLQPDGGADRVRFEVPADGTAERIAERLTCRVEPGPIPGRSDSRLTVWISSPSELHTAGVCWQLPALLDGFRRLAGRAKSEVQLHNT